MKKPIVESTNKNAKVIWQQVDEDKGVPEPAILITRYSDCIELRQEGKTILINYDTINELCKHLKQDLE